jgi:hypothetical protein
MAPLNTTNPIERCKFRRTGKWLSRHDFGRPSFAPLQLPQLRLTKQNYEVLREEAEQTATGFGGHSTSRRQV